MYLIVVFEDDNQTGPVAKEWFSGGLAWWPPYKDQFQILRAVQKRVMPDAAKGWRQFRARVLYESGNKASKRLLHLNAKTQPHKVQFL